MSAHSLRPYQLEGLAAITERCAAGVHRQLGVLPTGTGKTVLFAAAIHERGGRAVVLVHRDELVRQAVDKLHAGTPDARVGIVKAEQDETDAEIVVASVQTLASPRRLARLLGPYRTVVVDEAHHAAAETYRRVIDHLVTDETLLLGVTATPGRGDGLGLEQVFDEIVFRKTLPEMIAAGFLSDLRAIQVQMPDLDLDRVAVNRGDYAAGGLGDALEQAHLPEVAARAYCEHASGRRALVFTPTVDLAHATAKAFEKAGVMAEAVDGTTPIEERRATLERFHVGTTAVLLNCNVFTEGYDEPAVDCVINGRPTRSSGLYLQMIGRGTRRHPGKDDCLILDLVGSTTRHGLVTLAGLAGAAPEAVGRKGLIRSLTEDRPALAAPGTWAAELVAREVDLFRQRPMAWVKAGKGWILYYGTGTIVLEGEPGGTWRALDRPREGQPSLIASGLSLEWAQGTGEDVVREAGGAFLARSDAPWRSRPATDKQLGLLRRMRVRFSPEITGGEASDLISARMARRSA